MNAVKHLVRTISAVPNALVGTDSVTDVEHELAVYFEGGWTLFHVEAVGMSSGNVTMLYVLTKSEQPMIVPQKMEIIDDKPKRGRPAKEVIQ